MPFPSSLTSHLTQALHCLPIFTSPTSPSSQSSSSFSHSSDPITPSRKRFPALRCLQSHPNLSPTDLQIPLTSKPSSTPSTAPHLPHPHILSPHSHKHLVSSQNLPHLQPLTFLIPSPPSPLPAPHIPHPQTLLQLHQSLISLPSEPPNGSFKVILFLHSADTTQSSAALPPGTNCPLPLPETCNPPAPLPAPGSPPAPGTSSVRRGRRRCRRGGGGKEGGVRSLTAAGARRRHRAAAAALYRAPRKPAPASASAPSPRRGS